jgi:hypothetical protein
MEPLVCLDSCLVLDACRTAASVQVLAAMALVLLTVLQLVTGDGKTDYHGDDNVYSEMLYWLCCSLLVYACTVAPAQWTLFKAISMYEHPYMRMYIVWLLVRPCVCTRTHMRVTVFYCLLCVRHGLHHTHLRQCTRNTSVATKTCR